MVRGEGQQTRVHFKGKDDDYIVIVEDGMVPQWKKNSSIALAQVVGSFDVFTTNKHGTQGELNRASKQQLNTEFGSDNVEDAIKLILEKGDIQEHHDSARYGSTNKSNGPGAASGP